MAAQPDGSSVATSVAAPSDSGVAGSGSRGKEMDSSFSPGEMVSC